jgi:hypothetical protein
VRRVLVREAAVVDVEVAVEDLARFADVFADLANAERSRVGDYVAVGNGIRVNFLYLPKDHTARPISPWRL